MRLSHQPTVNLASLHSHEAAVPESDEVQAGKPIASTRNYALMTVAGGSSRQLACLQPGARSPQVNQNGPAGCCGAAVEEAEAEPAGDMPEAVDQFDFEAAIGGVARIEAEVCDGGSVGAGFMIDERHIVTVAHVIEATSILVEVNGDLAEAVTVGFDKERDIALLRSDIPLGDQTFELQDIDYTTGDQISAIGFPRGLDASLTTGVISNREVEFDFMPFSRFIQVDAPLNPGNSGGPVFNEAGDVIGIVDWRLSESQGLNFAIAVSSVDRVVETWTEELDSSEWHEAAGDDGDSVGTNDEVAEHHYLGCLPLRGTKPRCSSRLSRVAYRWGDYDGQHDRPTGHDGTGEVTGRILAHFEPAIQTS